MEWVPGTLEMRVVGVYDGQGYRSYRSVSSFLDGELTHENRGKWFYAHAGGSYDLQFVLEAIYEKRAAGDRSWSVDGKFSGSSLIICKVKRHKHIWIFIDSFWLFRDKLANIAKSIGMAKGDSFEAGQDPDEEGISDDEYERRKSNKRAWYGNVSWETLREYNKADCEILWKAIDQFETAVLELGGELQMTIASTGMNLFRRAYLNSEIDTHKYVNKCAVKAYAASRVEKFIDQIDDAYYYDVNSSFPFAMTFPAPGEFLYSTRRMPDDYDKPYLAKVDVYVPECNIPPLALRMKQRVFFPTGRWTNWFCSEDIKALIEDGGIVEKVREVLVFEPFNDLSGYCMDIYNKRKATSDPFQKIVYKYLLNCVYGKFAEMEDKESFLLDPRDVPLTKEDALAMGMREWLPGAWLKMEHKAIPHRLVPIATHITAIARRTLGKYANLCRDIHYCDTDGFSTKENLDCSNDLGGLKLEKLIHHGHFMTQKMYALLGETPEGKPVKLYKGKGMSRMTATRYATLMEGKTIKMERMSRIRERWSRGFWSPIEYQYDKGVNLKPLWSHGFDPRKDTLPKRFTYPDGYTRPWTVNELNDMLKDRDSVEDA